MTARQLPPGQQLAAPGKWPIVGERSPAALASEWTISVSGCVAAARSWSLAVLRTRPLVTRAIDIHCVTRWTIFGASFTGVPLFQLLDEVVPTDSARFISFIAHSSRNHSTSLRLADARDLEPLVALEHAGQPLAAEHGGPVRLIVPDRYFYKSVKWLRTVELLPEDRLGFWEDTAGYHNHADPWREERFVATGLSKREAAVILASRDISGRDLLGLDGSDRDLVGLCATDAKLRNANFRRARLTRANFSRSNLSGAQLDDADLRGAMLLEADLEGASFVGADLRGADLRGASLFGATFVDQLQTTELPGKSARIDATTNIDLAALDGLMPRQLEFVQQAMLRANSTPTNPRE